MCVLTYQASRVLFCNLILKVNGTSVRGMDHQSVVSLLKEAGTSVCLVISRELVQLDTDQVAFWFQFEGFAWSFREK